MPTGKKEWEENSHDIEQADLSFTCEHLVPLQGDEGRSAVMYGNVLLAGLAESSLPKGINDSNIGERVVSTAIVKR